MHILFLSDNFPPETNAPASRTFEHCREWVRAGHDVTVITCAPNFPEGKLFAGYKNRLWQSESVDGIRVIRVWTLIVSNSGRIRRSLDYMSFLLTGFLAAIFVRRVDVVVGTSPQFFAVCAAWGASLVKRAPFVFELRDLWPASIGAVKAMRPGLLLRFLERIELFLYRRAALIVALTTSFKQNLIARGIPSAKITVVTNGIDPGLFHPRNKDRDLLASLDLENRFVTGYIGTHGLAHGLDTILDAARLLRDQGHDHIRFLIVGPGAERRQLINRAKAEQLSNIRFVDAVCRTEVPRYWSMLDCSLVHLRRDPVFETVIPSKLFEAMAMGVPTILGVKGEAAQLVQETQSGVLVAPEDAAAMAKAILDLEANTKLRRQISENAVQAAQNFKRSFLAQKMVAALGDVVTRPQGQQETSTAVRQLPAE